MWCDYAERVVGQGLMSPNDLRFMLTGAGFSVYWSKGGNLVRAGAFPRVKSMN